MKKEKEWYSVTLKYGKSNFPVRLYVKESGDDKNPNEKGNLYRVCYEYDDNGNTTLVSKRIIR